jgi:uncharacterized integral membrane protein
MTEKEPAAETPTTGDTVPPATANEQATTSKELAETDATPSPAGEAGGTAGRSAGDVVPPTETERHPTQPAASKRTRIGAAWVAVAIAVIVLVLLLIFILQNQQQVTVSYFGANGHLPLGVLVLFSAAGGALLVVVLGFARIIQLRWLARQDRRATSGPSR